VVQASVRPSRVAARALPRVVRSAISPSLGSRDRGLLLRTWGECPNGRSGTPGSGARDVKISAIRLGQSSPKPQDVVVCNVVGSLHLVEFGSAPPPVRAAPQPPSCHRLAALIHTQSRALDTLVRFVPTASLPVHTRPSSRAPFRTSVRYRNHCVEVIHR